MRFDTQRKPLSTAAKWAVIQAGGGVCAYCGDEATIAEHVIPYVYCQNNDRANLVPSCKVCNTIAGAKMFMCFFDKRDYILAKRATPKWQKRLGHQHLICSECKAFFLPNIYRATHFLCPRCARQQEKVCQPGVVACCYKCGEPFTPNSKGATEMMCSACVVIHGDAMRMKSRK